MVASDAEVTVAKPPKNRPVEMSKRLGETLFLDFFIILLSSDSRGLHVGFLADSPVSGKHKNDMKGALRTFPQTLVYEIWARDSSEPGRLAR